MGLHDSFGMLQDLWRHDGRRRTPEYQIGGLLRHHDGGSIGVAGDDTRKYGSIRDSQSLEPPDSQLRVDDRLLITPHAAGTTWMKYRATSAANVLLQSRVVRHSRSGSNLPAVQRL